MIQKKPCLLFFLRAHSNGSIRRGLKADAGDAVTMRSGLGVNLKDVTVFNRGREKGQSLAHAAAAGFAVAVAAGPADAAVASVVALTVAMAAVAEVTAPFAAATAVALLLLQLL